ncbi:MAG: DnaA regulatory inactivator Hda [Panacagrimonas sp.]
MKQLPLSVQLRFQPDFEHFVAGPNQDLVQAVHALADGEQAQALCVIGAEGCGKTHLLQAAARQRKGAAYLPMRHLEQIRHDDLAGFEQCPLICIDDVDALAGNRDAEIALLRLLDRSKRGDTATLCSLRQAPDRIAGLLADLRTRLRQGALMSIRPLGDEDRAQLLQKNAQQRGLQWSPEVSQWLLARLPRNPARLVAAVDALDRAALSARRRLSLSFVQKTLRQAGEFPPPANAQTSAG